MRALAAIGAALAAFFAPLDLSAGGVSAVSPPTINQALIDGDTMPVKLSAFGLYHGAQQAMVPGLLRYSLRTSLFSDYADKARFMSIPAGKKATVASDGTVQFPVGTVLAKSFAWPGVNAGRAVETRLLIHRASGWVALPYVWDADGKDATLKVAGARIPVTFRAPEGTSHSIRYAVPNKNQCKGCHSRDGALMPIGPKAQNMELAGNISKAVLADRFTNPAALRATMPRWDRPADGSLDTRARAYLDVNCAHCHNPAGSASNSGLFLGFGVTDTIARGIGKRPVAAGQGSGGRDFAIAPGDPAASILLYRLESTHPGIAMPEVGRSTVHREGVELLREWIAQMPKATH